MFTPAQQEAITIIQQFIIKYDRLPTYHENKNTIDFPNGAFFRKSFGTLRNAMRAAGIIVSTKIKTEQEFTCSQCATSFKLKEKQLAQKLRDQKHMMDSSLIFCTRSCATSYTNKRRGPRSDKTKLKIKHTLKSKYPYVEQTYFKRFATPDEIEKLSNSDKIRKQIQLPMPSQYWKRHVVGEFSRLRLNTCKHCNIKWCSRITQKYCTNHAHLYQSKNRNQYAFTFSIRQHPEIFGHMSENIRQLGMWSYTNTNGLTRDHKISVNDAIKHSYDPYYIKHPLNCELMTWTENNKKNTTSSITYDELAVAVYNYENRVKSTT